MSTTNAPAATSLRSSPVAGANFETGDVVVGEQRDVAVVGVGAGAMTPAGAGAG